MIRHYFRLAVRHLAKQKMLTAINIIGLSLGLACCTLFMLYAVHEFNYDKWHVKADRIYRVNEVWTRDDKDMGMAGLYVPVGPAFKKEFPDVEEFVRISVPGRRVVRVDGRQIPVDLSFADEPLFRVFSFPLLKGSPATALKDVHSIVVTRDIAIQLFGSTDIIGKTLEIKQDTTFEPFAVSAIAENIPSNSSIRFDMMGNYAHELAGDRKEAINNWHMTFGDETYLLLHPGSSLPNEKARLHHLHQQYSPDEGKNITSFALEPLKQLHTDTRIEAAGPPGGTTDPKNIYILLAIAGGIIMIASINFTTLAIARSAGRAREVGVRKVIGGRRGQLIGQFLIESTLLTLFSAILGLLLTYILLPWFNHLSGKELTLSFIRFPQLIWMFTGLVLVVGLIAGSYPALVLSGFNAVAVLKNKIRLGGENFFTRALVTFQFVLSIGLIIATMIILRQVDYMRSKDLGLIKENTVVMDLGDVDGSKIYPVIYRTLAARPDVLSIGATQIGIGEGQGFMGERFEINGKDASVIEYPVDTSFIQTLGVHLLAGRSFRGDLATDTSGAVVINEHMATNELGLTPAKAVGQQFFSKRQNRYKTVIGVVKDFNFEKLDRKMRNQLFFAPADFKAGQVYIRLRGGDPSAALASMAAVWKSNVPDLPFRYSFLDENLDRWYKNEARWRDIAGWAGAISVALACLGLFGLAALTAINRIKEIGIRKILGASVAEIVQLLMTGFLRLVLAASLIASPLAWYFMNKWLQQWAYRIEMGWWIYAATALVAAGIAALTIGVQAFRAARANPVKNLRTE